MKTGLKLLVGIMLSPLFLQSCQNDELSVAGSEGRREIVFTSIIDDSHLSRAVGASWEQGDEIGLFMKKAGTEEVIRANVPYVTKSGNGNFVGKDGPMEFPDELTKVDFIAYYPYTTRAENYKQYLIDLTNQSNQQALDLMKAVNLTGRDATSPQGNLQFRHVLSKLVLNLTPSQGASLKGIKATVSALKVKGNANLAADGTITLEDQTAEVEMFVNEEGTQAEAVLLPQTFTGKLKLTIELNGQQREVTTNIADKLEAGKKYICNLRINIGGGGQITPEPEAKYTKWFETPVITDSQKNNYMYVTHYTDLKYANGQPVRNYSMLYDKDLKMAYWVAYPLHACYTTKKVDRKEGDWLSDPIVKNNAWLAVVYKNSYAGDLYRRGHHCPSNDRRATRVMNDQTFYVTNQTPQRQNNFNATIWANLELRINSWSTASDTVYVVTGAMPPAEGDTNNPKTIKDRASKAITIPGYYFKAVARKIGGKYHTIAFKLDHKDYQDSKSYMNYAISVSKLEEITGFTFFPQLDAATKQTLDKSKWN